MRVADVLGRWERRKHPEQPEDRLVVMVVTVLFDGVLPATQDTGLATASDGHVCNRQQVGSTRKQGAGRTCAPRCTELSQPVRTDEGQVVQRVMGNSPGGVPQV